MKLVCDTCASPLMLDERSPLPHCPRCASARALDDVLDWYVEVDEAPVGPLATAALRTRWRAGQIGPDTLAWRTGLADWQPIRELGDLLQALTGDADRPLPAWSPAVVRLARQDGLASRTAGAAAGSLAALAGAELLRTPQLFAAQAPQSARPAVNRFAGVALLPHSPPANDVEPAMLPPEPPPRRSSAATAATTFVLGAAVAAIVALMASERSKGRAEARAEAPPPAAPAALAEARPATPAAPPVAAVSDEPSIARGEVQQSAPVRVSDPPAPSEPSPPAAQPSTTIRPSASASAAPARKQGVARNERRVAAKPLPRREAPAKAAPRKEIRVAMATSPARQPEAKPTAAAVDELPVAPVPEKPAARTKATTGDPLLDAVSDDELERALGGGAAKPARSANAVYVPPAPGSDLPEAVSPSQINDAVSARLSSLRGCIEEQRAVDPAAKGTFKLRWVIGGDGTVREVKSASGEHDGQPISRCIAGVVKTIRFPASRTQGQEVVFPFKF